MTEICNECGRSVKFGSGNFVNRVPDCNTIEERNEMGKRFPQGDFLCVECDEKPDNEEDIYECEHCNMEFKETEILYRNYGGEIGAIAFCPRCKEETKLICVSDRPKEEAVA